MTRLFLVACVQLVGTGCATESPTPAGQEAAANVSAAPTGPWETIDPTFEDCGGST